MLLIPHAGCNREAVILILACHGITQGFTLSAYSANMLDIAPNFTGMPFIVLTLSFSYHHINSF